MSAEYDLSKNNKINQNTLNSPDKENVESVKKQPSNSINSRLIQRVQRLAEDKKARDKAIEDGKNWLELRKKEIFGKIQTTSSATTKLFHDDFFPRRKKVPIGDVMKKYFNIRPDPKYAAWFVKQLDKLNENIERFENPTVAVRNPDKSITESENKKTKQFNDEKGNKASNPLNQAGQPFWMEEVEEDEFDDEDTIVSSEFVEEVRKNVALLIDPPYNKTKFSRYMDIDMLKKDDILFERKLVFSNTLKSVINTMGEEKRSLPPEEPSRICWVPLLTFTSYVPGKNCRYKSTEGTLQDIIKK